MNATYHGIIKATCLSCDKITTDIDALEIMNDLDCLCDCGDRFTKWENKNGKIVITCEIEDKKGNTYNFREELN